MGRHNRSVGQIFNAVAFWGGDVGYDVGTIYSLCQGPPGGLKLGRCFPHTKSARMGEGSGSPGPHGDYLAFVVTDIEKTPQRKRDTKKR